MEKQKRTLVLLGVGSTFFTRAIVESLASGGKEWDVRMVDIDEECLDIAVNLGKRMVALYEAPVTITGSTDRLDVLSGADAVVCVIGVGGRKAWEKDVILPRQFNIHQSTGDTYGAGGVSRSLRMLPPIVEIARDMERLCPGALLINFSNPMGTCCRAVSKTTSIKVIGLCSGVRYFHHRLCKLAGVPDHEVFCKAIGVNHFTWITELIHEGKNILPRVRGKMEKEELREGGPFTWELFQTFDAFPCVGDGHICEFVPGWQGKGAYYGETFGLGKKSFEEYAAHWDKVFDDMKEQAYGRAPVTRRTEDPEQDTFRDEDLFAEVLSAAFGEGEIIRTVNLPNNGQAANILPGGTLEGTTFIHGGGILPLAFGDLPPGITAIMQRILTIQELTVEAALKGDRKLVLQALLGGNTVQTLAEAKKLTNCLLESHRDYLPLFFN